MQLALEDKVVQALLWILGASLVTRRGRSPLRYKAGDRGSLCTVV
jgi:hypothetical protein